jgi:tetratricopeptide (TPR) repeat protein
VTGYRRALVGLAVAVVPWSGLSRPAVAAGQASSPPFDGVAGRAATAREAGRLAEAAALYREGVGIRPLWDEGWWFLGTLHYELNQHREAALAFERFLELKPEVAPAWALRGLCEFQLGQYDAATRHISKAKSLGSLGNPEIRLVTEYHWALLLIRDSQFEMAAQAAMVLARGYKEETLELDEMAGLMVLRLPMLPSEIPAEKRDLVRTAGRAAFSYLALDSRDAAGRFLELLARYPDVPNVHYAHGIFLMQQQERERALAEFRRELEIQPDAVHPRLAIAFEYLERGDFEKALPVAEEAARLAPELFAARNAHGRALVAADQVERGVAELEAAVRLAPTSPEMHFSLARGYDRLGRREEAARERQIFKELDEKRRAQTPVIVKSPAGAKPE